MYRKITNIADLSSGYTFRGSVENDLKGQISVLQAKNISLNQNVTDTTDFATISGTSLRNPYFLERNDILVVSRGSGAGSFRSAIFTSDRNNVMPSSSVHVIRVKDVNVLPKYVSLYLNSEVGQKALLQTVTGGSYLQSVLVKNLAELKIPIPPIHTQKSIVALHENISEQGKIFRQKQEIQKNIINASFLKLNTN